MPARVLAFVSLVVVSAIIALACLVVTEPTINTALQGGAVSFALVGVVTYFLVHPLQGSTFGNVAFIPFLTCVLLYPAWPSVVLVSLGVLLCEFTRKKHSVKRVFNVAQHVLAASAAVMVFIAVGGKSLQLEPNLKHWPAEIAAVVAFLCVNTVAVAAVVAASEKKNPAKIWFANIRGSVKNDLVAIPFIHLSALIYVQYRATGAFFLALFFYFIRQLYQTTIQLRKFNEELLGVLVHTVEMRDPYTSGHSQRVAKYSRIIAKASGLPQRQIERIAIAALLHDVGKIHEIFAGILSKPSRLTPEERAIMELHPLKSAELVEKVSDLADILPSVRHHHENWDGTGYPAQLSRLDIPLGSRIIMFADTIDAMTTDRPYRKALGEAEVRAELAKLSGKQFDPYICEALLKSPHFAAIFTGEETRVGRSITQVFDLARRQRSTAVA